MDDEISNEEISDKDSPLTLDDLDIILANLPYFAESILFIFILLHFSKF
jgi:hypothetical protein